jgi:hypothetical protein
MSRLLIVLLLVLTPPAFAQGVRDAYRDGAFLEAAVAAEGRGGAEDLAFAARSLLAQALTGADRDVDALLGRAETNARRALALDPGLVEAQLQLAVALGMQGRRASVAEAVRKGYAREGRALIRGALARAPDEAWAHALEGGWNLEIVRRGGAVGARYYGASVAAGRAAFERARALAPDDPVIAYQYAVALLELDADRNRAEATRLLEAARACRAGDAFERRMQRKADRVAGVLAAQGGAAAALTAAARFR